MEENIQYSESWLLQELLKQYKTNKDQVIRIKKVDLFRLVIAFIRLNKDLQ